MKCQKLPKLPFATRIAKSSQVPTQMALRFAAPTTGSANAYQDAYASDVTMEGCDNTGAVGEQKSTEQARTAALEREVASSKVQLRETSRQKIEIAAAADANEERMLAKIETLEADNEKLKVGSQGREKGERAAHDQQRWLAR